MKTQQECWQALIDGETLVRCDKTEVHLVNGYQHYTSGGDPSPFSFSVPSEWHIKPKRLPFCDALRALVAGECKWIANGSVRLASRGGVIGYSDWTVHQFVPDDFNHEWELIK